MKRHSKVILVVLAVLLAIVAIALLGAKTYVESAGTRERIEAQLGRMLGLPLAISKVRLSPWGELAISGVSVPDAEGNFLEGATFRARCRFVPLLQRRFEIYGLRAEDPKIVWRQGADGKWTLPARAKTPASGEAKHEKKTDGFQVTVDGFKIVNATAELLDQEKKPVAKFSGVNVNYGVLTVEHSEGAVNIDRVQWHALPLTNVRAPFQYAEGTVTLTPLEATLAGGALSGALSIQAGVQGLPFTGDLKLAGADLAKLMNETAWAPNQFGGRIDADLAMHGTVRKLVKVEGQGSLKLTGAAITGFEFFSTIAEGLHIPEMADMHLGDSSVVFHLGDEKVFVDSLALNAAALKVLANGLVRLNGRITIDARLVLAERTVAEMPDFARAFVEQATNGESGIDFKVGGTMEKPKTDLLDKVAGKKTIGQAADIVSNLFGDKKKKEKKKNNDPVKTPPPPPLPALDPTVTTIVPPAEPVPLPAPPQP